VKTLATILEKVQTQTVAGPMETAIDAVCYDSRQAAVGALFCALPGEHVDGNDFISSALANGVSAVLSEHPVPADCSFPWVQVRNARAAMAEAAANLYDHPSKDLPVVGVTGTNGKTTTAFLLHHLIQSSWRRCGLIGTVQYQVADEVLTASRTTPESADLQALLAEMRDEDCRAAVMEVSSIGLDQRRVDAMRFAAGIFTNLSRDHLDYHRSMDDYFAAKRLLFEKIDGQQGGGAMVINRDDRWGEKLARADFPNSKVITFGQGVHCDFQFGAVRSDFNGTRFQLSMQGRRLLVKLPLIGHFNVYNALAALGAAYALDLNLRESIRHLESAPQVPGRLESVGAGRQINYRVYVDYAHTPDALENALKTLRDLRPNRIITVFGCGGDRDRAKRPEMGAVVDKLSDAAILTSDNPRTEDPSRIIADTKAGMASGRVLVMEDRREAIREAINHARARDIVLIAGKGHEAYQEINGIRHEFSDRGEARNAIAARAEA